MALLSILRYPDPRLYRPARPVEMVDEGIRQLVKDMLETMYAAEGIGLAAVQVNVPLSVIVIDVSKDRSQQKVFINPVQLSASGHREHEEGCLSVPGIYDRVVRADSVMVEAMNLEGESFRFEGDGLLATCLQHEMDHLLGKVFVDYLSPLKRNRIKAKLRKRARETF